MTADDLRVLDLVDELRRKVRATDNARTKHPSGYRPIPRDEWYDQVTGESA